MFRTYLKTAQRNLLKHRKHAILNILGMAVALGACILVFVVIRYEMSYDTHLKGYHQFYQVMTKDVDEAGDHHTAGVPFPATRVLRQEFPQFRFSQLMSNFGIQVTVRPEGDRPAAKYLEQTGTYFAEPEFAELMELKFLAGNASVLNDVSNVVLSRSAAEKYFGDWKQAVGKRLNTDNAAYDFQVAGVFEDQPENSDFPMIMLASYKGFETHNENNWPLDDWGTNTSNHQLFVQVPDGRNVAVIDRQLNILEKKYNTTNPTSTRTHYLRPLSAAHFDERSGNNGDHVTTWRSIYALIFVGFLVILMACINFVNLSTALALTRSREVGIRKVMGGSKSQLRLQIYLETAIVVLLAAVLALMLAWIALPYVKEVTAVQGQLSLLNGGTMLFVGIVSLVTILLSGAYPAFVMGRFRPIEALKSKINTGKLGGVSLRRVLVVLQFTFSQILIIATVIVISQMNFIRNADLGFSREGILMTQLNGDSLTRSRLDQYKSELLRRSDVKKVSFAFDAPSSTNSWTNNFAFDKMEDRNFAVNLKMGDAEYANAYGLKLVAGRFYEPSDTAREYVVNETLVRKCGLSDPQQAIGKMLRLGGNRPREVVGVVKDFKQQSLREEIVPIVIFPNKRWYATAGIVMNSNNLLRSRQEIQAIWDRMFPEYVYNASFLDENINRYYEQEERLSRLYKVYALLAIFISCLGLYGLVSFMVVRKTREVGIRKVLGAGVGDIVFLFSREFTLLIIIAFVLAAPAAWYFMNGWLSDFAYRIRVGIGVFAAAILLSLVVAWLTVGYKALKAAMANPVRSLRTE